MQSRNAYTAFVKVLSLTYSSLIPATSGIGASIKSKSSEEMIGMIGWESLNGCMSPTNAYITKRMEACTHDTMKIFFYSNAA